MVRVLVEDERKIAKVLAEALTGDHYEVLIAGNGEDGFFRASAEVFDLVVLDIMLPGRSGLEILQALRQRQIHTPVLILTARDGVDDRVCGLDLGADDYLVKPFRMEEVVMRLRALVRRAAGHAAPLIVCGPVAYDAQLGAFSLDGLPLRLTALEWRVLSCLMLRKEHVVARRDLLERVYDGDADVDSNSVEVIVARLRRKVGHTLIQTVRGLGYRLTAEPP